MYVYLDIIHSHNSINSFQEVPRVGQVLGDKQKNGNPGEQEEEEPYHPRKFGLLSKTVGILGKLQSV